MRDFIDFMKVMGIVMAVLILLTGILLVPISWSSQYTCGQYGEIAGLDTEHFGVTVCMIEDPDLGWVTYGERKASRIGEKVSL